MKISPLDRVLLLITGILAAYQVAVGIDGFDTVPIIAYTIAFGIRNVTRPEVALAEAFRVLRPGGRLMVLEFGRVPVAGLRRLYDLYSFNVIPPMGQAARLAATRLDSERIYERLEALFLSASQGETACPTPC